MSEQTWKNKQTNKQETVCEGNCWEDTPRSAGFVY